SVGTIYYYAIVTLPSTGGCSAIVSQTAAITINALPTISLQPLQSQSVCVGGTISESLSVAYQGGTGNATYQWFSNTTNDNTTGTLITGATQATYTPPTFVSAGNYYYYVVVTLDGTGCGS